MSSVHSVPENIIKTNKPIYFLVPPTNSNGTEYYANIIARCFWNSCGTILHKYNSRNEVYKIYNYWCNSALYPQGLRKYFRNFSQVLYSLVHDGNVCGVIGNSYIRWSYNSQECPPQYLHWDYDLQSELGKYIHADTPNDFIYASRTDCVVSNSRRLAKIFYLKMGHLCARLNTISDLLFLYVIWMKSEDWDTSPNHYHVLSNLQYYLQVCYMNYDINYVRWL